MISSSLFPATVYVANPTGISAGGDKTYGTPAPVKVRVEKEQLLVRSVNGNELQSSTQLQTTTAILQDAQLWLPGADPTTDQPQRPIKVDETPNKRGTEVLYEVFL